MTSSQMFHSGASLATGESAPFERLPTGGAIVRNKRIFRVGTFRDSTGKQRTWTAGDLADMASNFVTLQAELPNVPIRRDHTRSVGNVMGYFESLHSDDEFLYGDYKITEPEDANKYERGTYRSISIEVGSYRTNNDETYSPVVLGLAHVDLPAVEGLFTLHQEDEMTFTQEEMDWAVAAVYAQSLADAEGDSDYALAIGYAQADLDVRAEFAAADDDKPPFQFVLSSGDETTDYGKVQADLTAMGTVLSEQRNLFRNKFVDDLVSGDKIIAPMAATLKNHVIELNETQYASFVATYEQAPKVGILDDHSSHGGNDNEGQYDVELQKLEAQLAMHRNSGLNEDQIKALGSYSRVQEIKTMQAQEV